ncbi:MAG: ACP S-malonyltransferase [Stomatobaculum sp.]|nr:ACP S-malonyltransferase [Stomatobaculum sp.]
MSKTAFLFPGQGAQKCGMARSFYETDPDAKAVIDRASELLGMDMPELLFTPNDRLDRTEFTQPAMVTAGIAMLQAVAKTGLKPDVCAGLSLGEYEALYAAGAMSADDAVRTVQVRGKLMAEAVPAGVGGMAAVVGAETALVEETIAPIADVWIANYNCPGQIVISGKKEALAQASDALKAAGVRRVLPLNVSGPFHSGLLAEAGEKLGAYLAGVEIRPLVIPYAANFTGAYVTDSAEIVPLLVKQVSGSVRFEQSIRGMLADGVDTFVEIGPGKTIAGFLRKIDREAKVINIETAEDLEKCRS